MADIDLRSVTVRSANEGSRARPERLDGISLTVPDGAFVAVVGGSGSGKTSLLRAVAGLDRLESGEVHLGGRNVTQLAPGDRDLSMVFHTPALIGHYDVGRNVAFPLEVRKYEVAEIRRRVDAEVRALHIEELLERPPSTLSHGEQQMVQIARALVRVPSVLLLDEPFASLDDMLRRRLRSEVGLLQAGYGVTTVMATNDGDDVRSLAAMVAVLEQGRLVQWGTTAEVQRSPVNLLAAVATGPLSLIDMTVVADREGFWLLREDPVGGELVRLRSWAPALGSYVGREVTVGVRPADVEVNDSGTLPAVVERTALFGTDGISCLVAGVRITVAAPSARVAAGDAVRLRLHHHLLFDRTTDRSIG